MRSKTPRTLSRHNQRGLHPLGLRIPTRGVRHTHRPDIEKAANPAGRREFSAFVIGVTSSGLEGGYKVCEVPFLAGEEPKMKSWIAGALITCLTVVVVVGATTRHVSHKQDALWCHNHGYPHYATKDGFCVGAGGKLVKVGL